MRRIRGQSASELSLVVSVIALVAVAASTILVPLFADGIRSLGGDGGANGGSAVRPAPGTATPADVNAALLMSDEPSGEMPPIGPPS